MKQIIKNACEMYSIIVIKSNEQTNFPFFDYFIWVASYKSEEKQLKSHLLLPNLIWIIKKSEK